MQLRARQPLEPSLFSDSIRNNITLFDVPVDEDRFAKAVNMALVDAFASDFPNGYDTLIGQHGSTVSSGQAQRIAIARAIYWNSDIMIFDEPTASMDANSEYEIMKKYKELTSRKISFMVSHRLSSTTMADKIIFIKNGEIYEQGDHAKLMADNLEYAKMFRRQAENYFV